ncbi:hypothetical protein [Kitasatospora sp. LaBMicrA B282]|uniref:hypothetical protein n=1 Tax=Kitasatospora sp. LaBMicrA B282 TaxID=3420949 RepID=UPI003D0E6289
MTFTLHALLGPESPAMSNESLAADLSARFDGRGDFSLRFGRLPFSNHPLLALRWGSWPVQVSYEEGEYVAKDSRHIQATLGTTAPFDVSGITRRIRVVFGSDDARDFTDRIIELMDFLCSIRGAVVFDPQQGDVVGPDQDLAARPTPARPEKPEPGPAFWAGYLMRLFRTDEADRRFIADGFDTGLAEADTAWDDLIDWALDFCLPLDDGYSVRVCGTQFPADWGTQWYLSHAERGRIDRIAYIDHLRLIPEPAEGPGLSWQELIRIGHSPDRTAPGVHDPSHRLLLLLPTLRDPDTAPEAADVVGAALVAAGARADRAARLAAFLLSHRFLAAAE